jgi:hypothetical protein
LAWAISSSFHSFTSQRKPAPEPHLEEANIKAKRKISSNGLSRELDRQQHPGAPAHPSPIAKTAYKRHPGATVPTATTGAGQQPKGSGYRAIAQTAVGRGIRHSFATSVGSSGDASLHPDPSSRVLATTKEAAQAGVDETLLDSTDIDSCLSVLASNYQQSLNHLSADPTPLSEMRGFSSQEQFGGFLSRNSSLVDLAMINDPDTNLEQGDQDDGAEYDPLRFVDFPNSDFFQIGNADQNNTNETNHHREHDSS